MDDQESYRDYLKRIYDPGRLFDKPEPLKGIRVLEVGYVHLGPAACEFLAQFGAEVIKFEGRKGDLMRFVTPYAFFYKNMSPGLEIENRNKYWVGMHLGEPGARTIFLDLVKKSDVVVDNLTPGRTAGGESATGSSGKSIPGSSSSTYPVTAAGGRGREGIPTTPRPRAWGGFRPLRASKSAVPSNRAPGSPTGSPRSCAPLPSPRH